MKIKSVVARVSHTETYASGGTAFTSDQAPTVSFTNGLGQSCGGPSTLGLYQRSFTDFFNIFSRASDGPVADELDLTSCFNDASTSASQLSGATATFAGLVKPTQQEGLDGIELVVTLQPSDATTKVLMPESGCITIQPKYDNGYGSVSHIGLDSRAGDCAVWKWDSAEYRRTFIGFTTGNVQRRARTVRRRSGARCTRRAQRSTSTTRALARPPSRPWGRPARRARARRSAPVATPA